MFKRRIAAILAACAVGIGALVAATVPAHAVTYGEISLAESSGFCITTGGGVGTADVLGVCAHAGTQEFTAVLWSNTNQTYQLKNQASGLCITFNVPNGGPDG